MSKTSYTAVGFIAVLLWALLALFTVGSAPVPPFLLNALCFAIGGGIGVIWLLATGGLSQLRRIPMRVYLIGTAGLFGYHFLYFSALRMAPAAEAGLIAYLWPLLIVLFSGLLPGEHLKRGHIIGGLIGFAGAVLIVAQGVTGFNADALPGYGLAFLCALTWSGYSVVSRSFGAVPTASVVVFCLATAILSGVAHVALEDTIWPTTTLGWLSVIGLGVGPVGIAFFVWDVGVKKGDIQLLGVASYAAPVLSTLALVVAGIAAPTWTLLLAAALITGGAALAAQASRRP
ncbi:aromatic amino acid exporter YddG [Marivivens donghaensis]|jgi:drug/metabolite transporter (DMT)-like permease|uniref:aromatic amino acid exporter YddG n=1 Tax=Marivivens donghaensis TaxID=1699413 RepID=UPI003F69984C